jgi:hypothetical protein
MKAALSAYSSPGKRMFRRAALWLMIAAVAGCFGDRTMSATSSQTTPPKLPELEEFVFHPDQFEKFKIPRRLPPGDVARFLMTRLDRNAGIGPLQQTEQLVDFYDLNEVAAFLRGFLDGRESSPEQRLRAITIVRTIARSGAPDDRGFARDYFGRLVQRATVAELPELTSIYEALGPEGDSRQLRAAAEAFAGARPAPADARILRSLLAKTLPRAEQANGLKARTLAVPDSSQRVEIEIRMYTGLLMSYPEFLPAWAARRLRRETWADSPAQQITRAPDRNRSLWIAQAFRRIMPAIEENKSFTAEVKAAKELSCLRAIDFFGGTLTNAEYQELHREPARQWDVLSNL